MIYFNKSIMSKIDLVLTVFFFFYLHNTHQSHTHNHTSLITYTVITKKLAHVQRNTFTKTDVQVH